MWMITSLVAAAIASAAKLKIKDAERYRLSLLCLMLWGTFIMVLVDHGIAYLTEDGDFIQVTTDGLVPSGLLLGVLMLVPIFAIWAAATFTPAGALLGYEKPAPLP